ncbi:hypothetical protein L313_2441 [Acinetobacter haemolyticus CIP 64.3 = MTCC 9819]|nr:hypothetical protein L313_2441 [Acinetobacter haemolyticus CIP 64.3 = MTCC 9819]
MKDFYLSFKFLNGVCRHELGNGTGGSDGNFLNGVCRHELGGCHD